MPCFFSAIKPNRAYQNRALDSGYVERQKFAATESVFCPCGAMKMDSRRKFYPHLTGVTCPLGINGIQAVAASQRRGPVQIGAGWSLAHEG
jgi:hypothetical protein